MKRRLLNLLTVVSLVLCVAVATCWVRSYWVDEALDWLSRPPTPTAPTHTLTARSYKGRVVVYVSSVDFSQLTTAEYLSLVGWMQKLVPRPPGWVYRSPVGWMAPDETLGFTALSSRTTRADAVTGKPITTAGTTLGVPYWFLAALTAALPLLSPWRARRHRRRLLALGRCPRCGYDLTGNVSGVCPECGEVRR